MSVLSGIGQIPDIFGGGGGGGTTYTNPPTIINQTIVQDGTTTFGDIVASTGSVVPTLLTAGTTYIVELGLVLTADVENIFTVYSPSGSGGPTEIEFSWSWQVGLITTTYNVFFPLSPFVVQSGQQYTQILGTLTAPSVGTVSPTFGVVPSNGGELPVTIDSTETITTLTTTATLTFTPLSV